MRYKKWVLPHRTEGTEKFIEMYRDERGLAWMTAKQCIEAMVSTNRRMKRHRLILSQKNVRLNGLEYKLHRDYKFMQRMCFDQTKDLA